MNQIHRYGRAGCGRGAFRSRIVQNAKRFFQRVQQKFVLTVGLEIVDKARHRFRGCVFVKTAFAQRFAQMHSASQAFLGLQ